MPSSELRAFVVRVIVVLALVACAWMMWALSDLLLMVFGAIVVAVLLRALSGWVRRRTRLSDGWALALVVIVLTLGFTALLWLFGSQLASEVGALQRTLPQAWTRVHDWLAAGPLGPALDELTRQAPARVSNLAPRAGAFALSITGGVANLFLVLAGAVYLAAQPQLYRRGALLLLPAHVRATTDDALQASGTALRLWLRGQLIAMAVVGVLTGLGLWALGIPGALALGIVAGLLDFVPIVGPILAAIPAILLGFTVSPQMALATAALFVVVQQIEGNLLLPVIQQRTVDLPPVLLLFSLFGIGMLLGLPGVLLAAPLTVVGYVLIKRLYVQEALGTPTTIPGQKAH
ncbi:MULTISPECIES: AI-2E family transporter [unclassified Xanthomonas]|uniref:AI-2E family transporter n=1 Tax=unclassified Xanthomonas TaxID=2643310 RepID=UPI0021690A2D|nr:MULTISPECIES: AI-2E family transporter [unclassified Xanthomonas]MCS3748325.1 putative PurR-regulated permease PerM [Xanthomonas sp. 3793]MCS3809698.1 putative PurR-regulated permease PerM [Xanthomonas sp. 4461]